ncbi:MAG: thioredoxin family protein [Planctomycetaceae bacterium]|nr:thioredoxin family protein [Planctomycetaceae bacterium]
MFIQVLGTGCAKCNHLAVRAEEAAEQSGKEYTLEKVTDINHIIALGVLTTPALIVDGKIVCSGTVPSVEEIRKLLEC